MYRSLALLVCGCSFAFVHGPDASSRPPANKPPACTTLAVAPSLDVLMALTLGTIAAIAVVGVTKEFHDRDAPEVRYYYAGAGVAAATLAIVYGFSAHSGFDRIDRCELSRSTTPAP